MRRMLSVVIASSLFLAVGYLVFSGNIVILDFWTGLAVASIPMAIAVLMWGFKSDILRWTRRSKYVVKTSDLGWSGDLASRLDPKLSHVCAFFFYPKEISYEKGERNPMKNMPRFKAIVNYSTKEAFWMAEYAIELFRKGKIQWVSADGENEEEMSEYLQKRAITLFRRPATKADLVPPKRD